MSFNTQISIDISFLPQEVRKLLPYHLELTTQVPKCEYCGEDLVPPSNITVNANVPAERFGDNLEYGTSVFAAGRYALELARIALASAGTSKASLDLLTTAHVSIRRATVPYVFQFFNKRQTDAVIAALSQHVRLLGLAIWPLICSDTIEYSGSLVDSNDGLPNTEAFADNHANDVSMTLLRQPFRKLIRIEVALDEPFLAAKGWQALESWRNAYAENRYKEIFGERVRGLLRLDTLDLTYAEPRKEFTAMLGCRLQDMLRHYLSGNDPEDHCTLVPAKMHRKKARLMNEFRDTILSWTGADIKIPWRTLRVSRPILLSDRLKYPGDWLPSTQDQRSRFCKANWPQILKSLRDQYTSIRCDTEKQLHLGTAGSAFMQFENVSCRWCRLSTF
jgi:hypothetical protein